MSEVATVPLRKVAELAGVSQGRVYELFRRPDAPHPVAIVACVPVFELAGALEFVEGLTPRSRRRRPPRPTQPSNEGAAGHGSA